ncbi:hypothetical protein D3C78_1549620 [compost metagenome]
MLEGEPQQAVRVAGSLVVELDGATDMDDVCLSLGLLRLDLLLVRLDGDQGPGGAVLQVEIEPATLHPLFYLGAILALDGLTLGIKGLAARAELRDQAPLQLVIDGRRLDLATQGGGGNVEIKHRLVS